MTAKNAENNNRVRRLGAYLVAGAGAFAGVNDAQGAIVYTPGPFVANNSTINIDFDGGGLAEFNITHASGATTKPKTKTFNQLGLNPGPGAIGHGAVGVGKPALLGSGVTVSGGGFLPLTAVNPSNLAGNSIGAGNWSGGQTGFIGVQFGLLGGTRFGWIHLTAPASGQALNTGVVHGYAYEDSGASILTGDQGSLSSVPEPSSMLLLATGALGVLAMKRRKAS